MTSPSCAVLVLLLLECSRLPAEDFYRGSTSGPGQLVVDGGVSIASVRGSPTEIGTQLAGMAPTAVAFLLTTMVHSVDDTALAQIPASYQEEMQAIASTLAIDVKVLATANLIVDRHCSAIVYQQVDAAAAGQRQQPLMVARNMDYAPAGVLGPGTLLTIYHGAGLHAFASIGWPGYCGVVSGMNDAGICAAVLLNDSSSPHHAGEPICFRVREMLEQATTLEAAVRIFSASPVASNHYVVIADALTACVLWNDGRSVQRQGLVHGWLTCTNAGRTSSAEQLDTRAAYLGKLIHDAHPDEAWMRCALTGCYLTGINAQSMLFIPETRQLELSLSTATTPAALGTWHAIDLRALFSATRLTPPLQTSLGVVPAPLPHYTAH